MAVSQAQSVGPSQVTPQSLAPAKPPPAFGVEIGSPLAIAAPVGSENLKITIRKALIEGGFDELSNATAAIVASLELQKVSVARLYGAARDLEQAYIRAGYVLVRVTLPPQRLIEGGVVKFVVIDGFIESVRTDGVPERARSIVLARIAGLLGRPHLKLAMIERALLIAGDFPGLRLKSALTRGEQPGGAILVVEGDQRLFTGTVGIDNRLPASLGTWQWNTLLALNSALGFGEQIYGAFGSGLNMGWDGSFVSPLQVVGGGIILPVGVNGWTLNPEYTHSRTRPTPAPGSPASVGDFDRWALRSNYPLIRDRSQTLSLTGAIEYISQTLTACGFGTELSHDRYTAWRTGITWQAAAAWGEPYQINAQLSQGLGGRGALDAAASSIPLSRQGASPEFTKLAVDVRLNQPLPLDSRLDLIAKAQTSFAAPLLLSEQFALDGVDAISAYPNGSFAVDSGVTVRAELAHLISIVTAFSPLLLSPYVFAAEGWGHLVQPTAVETANVNAAVVGAGARYAVELPSGFDGASFGLEIARQFSNVPTQTHGYRGTLVLAVRY